MDQLIAIIPKSYSPLLLKHNYKYYNYSYGENRKKIVWQICRFNEQIVNCEEFLNLEKM